MPSFTSFVANLFSSRRAGAYEDKVGHRRHRRRGNRPVRRPETRDPDRYADVDRYDGSQARRFGEDQYSDRLPPRSGLQAVYPQGHNNVQDNTWRPGYEDTGRQYPPMNRVPAYPQDLAHQQDSRQDSERQYRTEERVPMGLERPPTRHGRPGRASAPPTSHCFGEIRELRSPSLRNSDEALELLQYVASLVAPIMRRRGWRVPVLEEFVLDDGSGDRIHGCHEFYTSPHGRASSKLRVRIRSFDDPAAQFMGLGEVVDTVVHELAHIEHQHHNRRFRGVWNELRCEFEDLYPWAGRLPRMDG
ncbi:hypothetical protein LTR08_008677 [Meristemomyces frigidus]|nr:hypothetical protein LTR08_008677 [Meristemomyces frigidus]